MTNSGMIPSPLEIIEGAADTQTEQAEVDYSRESEKIAIEKLREELEGAKQDRIQRKEFAEKIFIAVMLYLFLTLVILIACGNYNLFLSDTVLVALLTTASANVIGILLVVVKYLFHHK